ncbi:Uncharacterised protein [Klebsiella pneumoniae]|jgi:hypothetical protein|nr:Uncharacterised protein [Klebsiella pneumoniae]DAJ62879.1 MAG TPA: hypothetical protein [Bacteriophage sp.]
MNWLELGLSVLGLFVIAVALFIMDWNFSRRYRD